MDKKDISVVICCAGMGTRLGIGTTKALVNICGKPLILRQLELLKDYDDIRIVVGYQAERVIEKVNTCRKDILYAFNYEYEHTGVGESLKRGMLGARKYTVAMDGDVLVNPEDFQKLLDYPGACVGVSKPHSGEPVFAKCSGGNVVGFDQQAGSTEWCGIAKVESDVFLQDCHHVYEMLEAALPLPALEIRAREIDTQDDYEEMLRWVEGGYRD